MAGVEVDAFQLAMLALILFFLLKITVHHKSENVRQAKCQIDGGLFY